MATAARGGSPAAAGASAHAPCVVARSARSPLRTVKGERPVRETCLLLLSPPLLRVVIDAVAAQTAIVLSVVRALCRLD